MTIKIPGVDTEKGLELYDDDLDIYVSVLRSYASNTPAALDKLRNVSAETLSDYAATVHGVKGISANIGAEEAKKAAAKLEEMAKNGDLPGVLAQNEAFLKQMDDLVSGIRNWLKEFDANE